MNDTELDSREGTLEFAMISAIFMIAEMDDALSQGCVEIVAEEILTKLEASAPLLLAEVARNGLREQLLSHIAAYGLLRTTAPYWLDLETYLESRRKIFLDDLIHVLDADKWDKSNPAFYSLFMSIAPVVEAKLDDAFSIPF
jgi:hypothetical protein